MPEIIYNITLNIDHAVAGEWLKWMKEVHIPDVMRTGMFSGYRLLRLVGDEESGGITYAVQYIAPDMETYEKYRSEFAPALQAEHTARFKDRFVAFRTILEVVE